MPTPVAASIAPFLNLRIRAVKSPKDCLSLRSRKSFVKMCLKKSQRNVTHEISIISLPKQDLKKYNMNRGANTAGGNHEVLPIAKYFSHYGMLRFGEIVFT